MFKIFTEYIKIIKNLENASKTEGDNVKTQRAKLSGRPVTITGIKVCKASFHVVFGNRDQLCRFPRHPLAAFKRRMWQCQN